MSAANWCRIEIDGRPQLGCLEGQQISLYEGGLFEKPVANGVKIDASTATWVPPVEPRQFSGLWNNLHERQQLEKTQVPDFPLFFVKLGESLSAHQRPIKRPPVSAS